VEVLRGGAGWKAGQRGLLDISNAAMAALGCHGAERWDAMAKLEQQFAMLSADGWLCQLQHFLPPLNQSWRGEGGEAGGDQIPALKRQIISMSSIFVITTH